MKEVADLVLKTGTKTWLHGGRAQGVKWVKGDACLAVRVVFIQTTSMCTNRQIAPVCKEEH